MIVPILTHRCATITTGGDLRVWESFVLDDPKTHLSITWGSFVVAMECSLRCHGYTPSNKENSPCNVNKVINVPHSRKVLGPK